MHHVCVCKFLGLNRFERAAMWTECLWMSVFICVDKKDEGKTVANGMAVTNCKP